jgi:hypothetical protein
MTRPSVEQWEVRQMMLNKLESAPESLKFSKSDHIALDKVGAMGQKLHEISGELTMYADEWDRSRAMEDLKATSEQYNSIDPASDPQAPLKALISDTARFLASASVLNPEQSSRFFENFSQNSVGVFSDPRSGDSLRGGHFPKEMIMEASQKLTMGMGNVSSRMMIEKAGNGLRQASSINAEANLPRSAFEIANNRSFDQEMSQKKDPFSHLRGREIAIERNQESKAAPSAPMEPK